MAGGSLWSSKGRKRPLVYHECVFCGKMYTEYRELECHINGHTGEEPFECNKCGETFANRHNFYNHSKICKPVPKKKHKSDRKRERRKESVKVRKVEVLNQYERKDQAKGKNQRSGFHEVSLYPFNNRLKLINQNSHQAAALSASFFLHMGRYDPDEIYPRLPNEIGNVVQLPPSCIAKPVLKEKSISIISPSMEFIDLVSEDESQYLNVDAPDPVPNTERGLSQVAVSTKDILDVEEQAHGYSSAPIPMIISEPNVEPLIESQTEDSIDEQQTQAISIPDSEVVSESIIEQFVDESDRLACMSEDEDEYSTQRIDDPQKEMIGLISSGVDVFCRDKIIDKPVFKKKTISSNPPSTEVADIVSEDESDVYVTSLDEVPNIEPNSRQTAVSAMDVLDMEKNAPGDTFGSTPMFISGPNVEPLIESQPEDSIDEPQSQLFSTPVSKVLPNEQQECNAHEFIGEPLTITMSELTSAQADEMRKEDSIDEPVFKERTISSSPPSTEVAEIVSEEESDVYVTSLNEVPNIEPNSRQAAVSGMDAFDMEKSAPGDTFGPTPMFISGPNVEPLIESQTEDSIDEQQTQAISIPDSEVVPESRIERFVNESDRLACMSEDEDEYSTQCIDDTQKEMIGLISSGADVFCTDKIIDEPVLKEKSISIVSPSMEFIDLVSEDESQDLNVDAPDSVQNTERDFGQDAVSTKNVLGVQEQAPGYSSAPIPMIISEPYTEPLIESQTEDSIDEPQTQAISISISEVVPESRIEQFVNESDRLTCMSEDEDSTQRIDDPQKEMIGLISSGVDVFCTDKIVDEPVLKEKSISIISPSMEFIDLVSEDESQYLNVDAADSVPNTERNISQVAVSTKDVLDVEEQAPGYSSAPIPMTISKPNAEPLIDSQTEDSIDEPQTQAISISVSVVVPESRIEQFVNESDRLTCMSEDEDEYSTQRIDDPQRKMIGLNSPGVDVFCTDKIIDEPVFKEKTISSNPPSTEVADIVSEDESDVYVTSLDEVPNIEPNSRQAAVSAMDVLDMEKNAPGDTFGSTPMFISGPNVEPLIESQTEDSIDEQQTQAISIPDSEVVSESIIEQFVDESDRLACMSEDEDEYSTQRIDDPQKEMMGLISSGVDVFCTDKIIDKPVFNEKSISSNPPSTEVADIVSEDESDVYVTSLDEVPNIEPNSRQAAVSAMDVLDMEKNAPGDSFGPTPMFISGPNVEPLIESQPEDSIDEPQSQLFSTPVSKVLPNEQQECNAHGFIGEPLTITMSELTSASVDEIRTECSIDEPQTHAISIPVCAAVPVSAPNNQPDTGQLALSVKDVITMEIDHKKRTITPLPVAKHNCYQCRFCGRDFKNDRSTLAQHIVRSHSERRGAKTICAFCKNSSNQFSAAVKHLRLYHHDLLLKIDANSGNSVTIDRKSVVVQSPKSVNVVQDENFPPVLTIGANDTFRHEDDASYEMPVLEPQVPHNLRDNQTLPRSTETNISVLPRCDTCGKVFTRKNDLHRHKYQVTKCERDSNLNLPLTCPLCNLQFAKPVNLRQHIVYRHGQTLPTSKVKCGLCSQISSSMKTLFKHTKSKHDSFLRPTGGSTNTRIQ